MGMTLVLIATSLWALSQPASPTRTERESIYNCQSWHRPPQLVNGVPRARLPAGERTAVLRMIASRPQPPRAIGGGPVHADAYRLMR